MPPRPPLLPPAGSFYPPNDGATYRDLLLFEERLKTNAMSLTRRKRRYQLFLLQLLLIIAFLLCEVGLQTNLLGVPYKWLLHRALPDLYPADAAVRVHPYFASGLLFVSVTTLVLFFASGMYAEKIGYANRYVPQANRALRNFNMHLNTRQPPLRAKLPFNPFAFLFARPPPPPASPPASPTPAIVRRRSPSPSRSPGGAGGGAAGGRRGSSVPIPPIPPAANARGELIFSSRVDRAFREAYDRYRAQFERRREERERAAYARTWLGWAHLQMPWMRRPVGGAGQGQGQGQGQVGTGTGTGTNTPVGSLRGMPRTRVASSPAGSRRSSPAPGRSGRRASGMLPGSAGVEEA
ncbi:uncharacterized protein BXZ73DRAFT_92658 [Epithele typhae]|uniref:uncharacterized protein n=1 Tax=Epithele typhae TaxID=378194 RepID=UPI0020077A3F|nr:uncharacterized protein BXZ73DRAFT_92658 [Epithele typhae]KAH9915151.1 hypothetical protein BXZ73DRAFT_92658 [Epithele typhae]